MLSVKRDRRDCYEMLHSTMTTTSTENSNLYQNANYGGTVVEIKKFNRLFFAYFKNRVRLIPCR